MSYWCGQSCVITFRVDGCVGREAFNPAREQFIGVGLEHVQQCAFQWLAWDAYGLGFGMAHIQVLDVEWRLPAEAYDAAGYYTVWP